MCIYKSPQHGLHHIRNLPLPRPEEAPTLHSSQKEKEEEEEEEREEREEMAVVLETPTPTTKSVYLGTLEEERPEFGIIIDKENDADLWCSNIYTDQTMRISQICNQWKTTAWDMFDDDDHHLFPDFKKCTNINQHFDVVAFDFDDEKAKLFSEKRFGFYVKNKNHRDGNDDGVLMRIYSQQEKRIVMNFVTYNGKGAIYRYGDEDNAFCLSENAQSVEDTLPSGESVCERASNNDVCSYIIMVTPIKNAEKKVTKKQKILCDGVDGIEDDGLLETDGVDGLLQTDCGGGGKKFLNPYTFGKASAPSSSKINKYKYTNVKRGGETKQKLKETKIRYEGAPITFYHVVLVSKNKEKR